MRRPLPPVLLTVVLLVCLAACSGEEDPTATASPSTAPTASAAASLAPTASPAASPASPPGATASDEPTAAVAFPANTRPDSEQARGGSLTVTAVRVGVQDGYDRVVFELDGARDGAPGWDVAYTDDPRQQGSGDRVEVTGTKVLAVVIHGIGYPFDTGVEEQTDDPALPAGLTTVQDVVLGATFEGDYQAFVGTSAELPFRVFRLADPARVVVDVRHS